MHWQDLYHCQKTPGIASLVWDGSSLTDVPKRKGGGRGSAQTKAQKLEVMALAVGREDTA